MWGASQGECGVHRRANVGCICSGSQSVPVWGWLVHHSCSCFMDDMPWGLHTRYVEIPQPTTVTRVLSISMFSSMEHGFGLDLDISKVGGSCESSLKSCAAIWFLNACI